MPRRVGKLVQHDDRMLAPVHEELLLGLAEDAALELVRLLDVLEPPGRPQRLGHQSQRLSRKNASRPTSATTMPAKITQNAHTVSKPGKCTFIPKKPVISVNGSSTTENTVRTRSTSFWRCWITDSFVSSSASTTSL